MRWKETTVAGMKGYELRSERLQVGIVTERGPRVAFLGRPEGENLLFWDEKDIGRNEWKLMGGHRVWLARPMADESEEAYRPDNDPCDVELQGDTLTVTAPKDPLFHTRRGISVKPLNAGKLSVDSFVRNEGDMLYSGGVWAITCTAPGAERRYGIPLGDGRPWDCFRLVIYRRWADHTARVNDPQITFTEDMLLVHPQGVETKRMIEAPLGVMAMDAPDQRTTFVKRTDYRRGAQYPMGCNLAFYVGPDNFMAELESFGPEVTLKPGEAVHHLETWVLTEGAVGLSDPQKLLEVFDR